MDKNWVRRLIHLSLFLLFLVLTIVLTIIIATMEPSDAPIEYSMFDVPLNKRRHDPIIIVYGFVLLGLGPLLGIYNFFLAFDINWDCDDISIFRNVLRKIKYCLFGFIFVLVGGVLGNEAGDLLGVSLFYSWLPIGIAAFLTYLVVFIIYKARGYDRPNWIAFLPQFGCILAILLYLIFDVGMSYLLMSIVRGIIEAQQSGKMEKAGQFISDIMILGILAFAITGAVIGGKISSSSSSSYTQKETIQKEEEPFYKMLKSKATKEIKETFDLCRASMEICNAIRASQDLWLSGCEWRVRWNGAPSINHSSGIFISGELVYEQGDYDRKGAENAAANCLSQIVYTVQTNAEQIVKKELSKYEDYYGGWDVYVTLSISVEK